MKKSFILAYCSSLLLLTSAFAQTDYHTSVTVRKPTAEAIRSLEKDIPLLMEHSAIPGLSAALIRDGKLVWKHNFGVMNAATSQPVNDETIFEAASLTKVVTSYAVLKLVDAGKFNIDSPLNKYLGNNYDVGDDKRIDLITARRILTHTSGFPNWRSRNAKTLPINFTPGERFSYSGEGFVYLSKVIEHLTNMKFEDYVKKTVFEPLGMKSSSFVWLDGYDKTVIYRHDWLGKMSFRSEEKGSNAAASMHTTAADYARFVIALLNGEGLKKKTWEEMLTPQIKSNDKKAPEVSWGLGIGLETTEQGKYFWHWGDQGDSKCYVTANVQQKDAIVYFTNSSNGLTIAEEILDDAIGGKHEALVMLNYGKYDPSAEIFFQSVTDKGAGPALKEYREKRQQSGGKGIGENSINSIGYKLLGMKKVDDAIEVFKQNTTDFPESGNAWDSLAEGYMIKGDKESAIKYYEKSLQLDAGNSNAAEQIKKLKS